ncbi:hypothetical protein ACC717_37495, partial [Rhizobium ruizarguesonis]
GEGADQHEGADQDFAVEREKLGHPVPGKDLRPCRPLFGNHGLWLAMNAFLLFRGFFLAMMVRSRADQTFRAAQ